MRLLTTLLITLPFAFSSPAAAPEPTAPFPIAASSFGPEQASLINNGIQSFLATVTAESAFQAAVSEFATFSDAGLVHDYRGDPNQLANEFFTATATPTWFSELPTPLQTFIEGLGSAQAALESSLAALSFSEPPASATGAAAPATTTSKAGAKGSVEGVGMGAMAVLAGVVGVGLL